VLNIIVISDGVSLTKYGGVFTTEIVKVDETVAKVSLIDIYTT